MTITKPELADLMRTSHQDAKNFAESEFGVELDDSESSLSLVDDMLSRCRAKVSEEKEDDKLVFTLCNIFGAYAGEIFRRKHGGEWIYDESNPEAPAVFLQVGEQTFTFMGMAYQRLMVEPSVSLALYYDKAAEQVESAKH
ncbi:hypothetical protein ACR0ST_01415 [Aliidiomarina sp. Khilg15.8]